MLMLPTRDAALLGRRTLALDRAALARCCRPVTAQRHSVLDVGVMIGQQLAGWAAVDVLIRQVGELLFAEPALRLGVRGLKANGEDLLRLFRGGIAFDKAIVSAG
jgi:hypothetical protein